MMFSLSRTVRPAALLAAVAWTSMSFAAAVAPTAAHAAEAPLYRAELVTPASARAASTVASGQLWSCTGTTCVSGKGTSRPAIVCARLAKEVGELSAFVADGKALDTDVLAKCNAK